MGQLSLCATATQALASRAHALQQDKSPQREVCTTRVWPLITTARESLHKATKIQCSQKDSLKIKKKLIVQNCDTPFYLCISLTL